MRTSIKMILTAILLLTFCMSSAFAQKIDAPEHVNEIYHSNTGKITVTIDADVIVPDVDRIPIYSAEYRFLSVILNRTVCSARYLPAWFDIC